MLGLQFPIIGMTSLMPAISAAEMMGSMCATEAAGSGVLKDPDQYWKDESSGPQRLHRRIISKHTKPLIARNTYYRPKRRFGDFHARGVHLDIHGGDVATFELVKPAGIGVHEIERSAIENEAAA
jgi:hypothetical protein